MNIKYFITCMTIICLPACAWIETTEEGSEVTLVKEFNVNNCLKLGRSNASVTHKIGVLTRDEEAVLEDLIIVAKNKAAEIGGDSIVAKGNAVEGKMSFDIYKCKE